MSWEYERNPQKENAAMDLARTMLSFPEQMAQVRYLNMRSALTKIYSEAELTPTRCKEIEITASYIEPHGKAANLKYLSWFMQLLKAGVDDPKLFK